MSQARAIADLRRLEAQISFLRQMVEGGDKESVRAALAEVEIDDFAEILGEDFEDYLDTLEDA